MSIFEVISTPTYRSLIKRRKSDLVQLLDGVKYAAGAERMTSGERFAEENRLADALARDILKFMRELPEGR
jgi:hypothetical protein